MTGARTLTALCAGATVAGITAAGWFLVIGSGQAGAVPALALAAAPKVPVPPRPAVESLAAAAAARDPFRASRAPAPVPFDPDRAADAPPTPPRPSLPPLTLVGVALGTEPAALIDGLPGTETTRVLRLGESFAGYTVRRIEETRVLITGPDTTWTLRVRGAQP
jgi:hypothetical protein